MYRNQRDLKSNQLLHEKFSQDLLQSQENERIRISKDLHDDLGQKLLIVKNQLINSGNEETKVLVELSSGVTEEIDIFVKAKLSTTVYVLSFSIVSPSSIFLAE